MVDRHRFKPPVDEPVGDEGDSLDESGPLADLLERTSPQIPVQRPSQPWEQVPVEDLDLDYAEMSHELRRRGLDPTSSSGTRRARTPSSLGNVSSGPYDRLPSGEHSSPRQVGSGHYAMVGDGRSGSHDAVPPRLGSGERPLVGSGPRRVGREGSGVRRVVRERSGPYRAASGGSGAHPLIREVSGSHRGVGSGSQPRALPVWESSGVRRIPRESRRPRRMLSGRHSAVLGPEEGSRASRGLLLGALALLVLGGGLIVYKSSQDASGAAELRRPIVEAVSQRGPIYDRLSAMATSAAPVEDSFCPDLGTPTDVTFRFRGTAPPLFPVQPVAEVAAQQLGEYDAGRLGRSALQAALDRVEQAGRAVIWVAVRDFRSPAVDPLLADQGATRYAGVRPGYLIADVFVADASNGATVCSFRIFASNGSNIARRLGPQRDLAEDLYAQTTRALRAGLDGLPATPGRAGGRYPLSTPPTGF